MAREVGGPGHPRARVAPRRSGKGRRGRSSAGTVMAVLSATDFPLRPKSWSSCRRQCKVQGARPLSTFVSSSHSRLLSGHTVNDGVGVETATMAAAARGTLLSAFWDRSLYSYRL